MQPWVMVAPGPPAAGLSNVSARSIAARSSTEPRSQGKASASRTALPETKSSIDEPKSAAIAAARSTVSDRSLAAELSALEAARAALAKGEASGAATLLDAYVTAYPHGRLELEAEVLRIDVLARSGKPDVAKKRAQSFLRRYPTSVLATHVRGYLND
jgi:TolA-binding protein